MVVNILITFLPQASGELGIDSEEESSGLNVSDYLPILCFTDLLSGDCIYNMNVVLFPIGQHVV